MTGVIVFAAAYAAFFSFIILELRAPDRGVSAWKVRAAGRFRARGRKSWRHFGAMLVGFGARHRRRQHHSGVVIPAPRACK